MKTSSTDFAVLVSKFLTEFLPKHRNYSKNTVLSYRDTLKLFIMFLRDEKSININYFKMKDLNRELVLEFIDWLQSNKSSPSTINQRIAAIKSFANFAQYECVEYMKNLQEIHSIKALKTHSKDIDYLTEEQVKTLINIPDCSSVQGIKHKIVLCLLYDTGARVQELCDIKIGDLFLGVDPKVKLHGKGNKTRIIPISNNMNQLLEKYVLNKKVNDEYLIKNKNNLKMSRDGIEYIIDKYSSKAREVDPTFPKKVHPHMFRHSKAMHMLAADIPIVYIRDFLGHENISTTMIYAKADNQLKTKAINELAPKLVDESFPDWTKDEDLLSFLNSFK